MSIAWQALAIGFQRYQAGATAEYSATHMQNMAIEQLEKLDREMMKLRLKSSLVLLMLTTAALPATIVGGLL